VASKDDGEAIYVHIKPQKTGNIITGWSKFVLANGDWSVSLQQYNCPATRFRLLANVFIIDGEALPGNFNLLPNGTSAAPWGPVPKDSPAASVFSEFCLAR
jgi:hypothetical protein